MKRLDESVGFEASQSGNKWRVKVIETGWGSSGYYGADMLAKYGPAVFTEGTKVFMNHPSANEATDRPERDIHQLAGKLVSNAVFNESDQSLYADVQFYSHYAPIIKEMAGDVGLSIHALGNAQMGEADGRKGPIIESLVADPLTSVDVVTVAGAGGKFISLLESYKSNDEFTTVEESLEEEGNMSITKEEFESAIAELKTAFVEALTPVVESVSILAEAAKPADVVEGEETPALDPVDVAEKFNESGLPKIALARVAESLKSESNTKSVDELLADEVAYATAIRTEVSESVAVEAPVAGNVKEAAKSTTLLDEFEAIVSRNKKG
jgi:hypothetical protein